MFARREAKTRIRQRDWLKLAGEKFAANKKEAFLLFCLFARTNSTSGKRALHFVSRCRPCYNGRTVVIVSLLKPIQFKISFYVASTGRGSKKSQKRKFPKRELVDEGKILQNYTI